MAPSTPGQYVLQWRMQQDGSGRFGDATPYATVNVTLPPVHGTWAEYDALGRVTSSSRDTENGLATSVITYLAGNRSRSIDPLGYATETQYQSFGTPEQSLPVNVISPESTVTEITRDRYGRPVSIIRKNTNGTQQLGRSFVYGSGGTLCKSIEPESGSTTFAYDGSGNVLWTASGLTLPNTQSCDLDAAYSSNRRVDRTYDARNRVLTLTFPGGNGDQTWVYTANGLPSQIMTRNDDLSSWTTNAYTYNKRGLMTGESTSVQGWFNWSIGHAYDANGSRSGNQYPSGLFVPLSPNALGQPTRVGDVVSNVTYNSNGAPSRFRYANGLTFEQDMNVRQLPYRISTSPGISGLTYSYGPTGNVDGIADTTDTSRNRQMTYDGLGRLITATSAAFGGNGTFQYAYDALDNLRSAKLPGRKDHTYYYDASNRLTNVSTSDGSTTIGLSYDSQGNLAVRNGQQFIFDVGNRLRSAPGPENYRYDAQGRRVLAWLQGSGSILSMYDNSGLLRRQQSERNGIVSEHLYLGTLLVATIETGADGVARPKYHHPDAQGTPVVTTDANGAVSQRSLYDPYGQLLNRPITDGIGFTGHVSDSVNSLIYMQQRYYDAGVASFLSTDPVTALTNPVEQFNRYRYANGNPYRFVDPEGMVSDDPNRQPIDMRTLTSRPSATSSVVTLMVNGDGGTGRQGNVPIKYNAPKPRTVPPSGANAASLQCTANCSGLDELLVTGGAEQSGHSSTSMHYKDKAVDIVGPPFNQVTHVQMILCAKACGYTHGGWEVNGRFYPNGDVATRASKDHWHFQLGAGGRVPSLPGVGFELPTGGILESPTRRGGAIGP